MRGRFANTLMAVSLAVALPLCAILAISFVDRYESRLELVEQQRIGYARLSALAFTTLVDDAGRSLALVGSESSELTRDPARAAARLQAVTERFPADYVVLCDSTGAVLASSDPSLASLRFTASRAFSQALSSETGFGIEPSSLSLKWGPGLHVAQRLEDASGEVTGVMLMRIDIDRLHDEFPVSVQTGGISIIDSEGQVVFQNESNAYAHRRERWGDRFPFVRAALSGEVAPTRDFHFPTGERRIGAFVPIEPIGWAAGSSVDASVPFLGFWRSASIMLPAAVLIAFLGLVIAGVISLRVRRSLVTLAQDARRIGAGDFETPVAVTRSDEIGAVADSLERARRDLQRYAQELARHHSAEHDIAEKLQKALLSLPSRVDGIEFGVRYLSATDTALVGGDFYDVFPLDEGRVGITIGDLAGHGVDAAVLTSLVRTAIRVRASEPDAEPDDVLVSANQVLYGGSESDKFATAWFGILDTESGELRYSSGGHPTAMVMGREGVRRLATNSPIVGAFPHVPFASTTVTLSPGDTLFLYTDGLIEARAGSELYGDERLCAVLDTLSGLGPEAIVRDVFAKVSAFTDGRFHDDVAILALRLTG